jgi:hypothetical protein
MAANTLSLVPARFLEEKLLNDPTTAMFQIGGVMYTRAQVLAQFNLVDDPSNVWAVGLSAISGQPLTQVTAASQVS